MASHICTSFVKQQAACTLATDVWAAITFPFSLSRNGSSAVAWLHTTACWYKSWFFRCQLREASDQITITDNHVLNGIHQRRCLLLALHINHVVFKGWVVVAAVTAIAIRCKRHRGMMFHSCQTARTSWKPGRGVRPSLAQPATLEFRSSSSRHCCNSWKSSASTHYPTTQQLNGMKNCSVWPQKHQLRNTSQSASAVCAITRTDISLKELLTPHKSTHL